MDYLIDKQGFLLIINNLSNQGSKDILDIRKTFLDLGFLIKYEENQSAEQISELCENISQNEIEDIRLDEVSCFICIILAYNIANNYVASSNDSDSIIDFDNIITYVGNCDALENKPKLFLLQAYVKNEEHKAGGYLHHDAGRFQDFNLPISIKIKEDFFFAYSTIFYNNSSISEIRREGSHFFQIFCDRLKNNINDRLDICNIMTNVNRFILLKQAKLPLREMCCFITIFEM